MRLVGCSRSLVAIVAALALAVAGPGAFARGVARGRTPHLTCRAATSSVIGESASLLAWRTPSRFGAHDVAACTRPSGTVYLPLDLSCPPNASFGCGVAQMAHAGLQLAFEVGEGTSSSTNDFVELADIGHGVELAYALASSPQLAADAQGSLPARVDRLEPTGYSTVAWSTKGFYGAQPAGEIWVYDSRGSTMVAAGPDVDPNSLAVTATRAYWIQDGVAHTTAFAGPAPTPPRRDHATLPKAN